MEKTTLRRSEIDAARDLIEEYGEVEIITIKDPVTDTEAPVALGREGVSPICASLFTDYLSAPRRRKGTAFFTTIDSMIAHVNRFKDEASALFAIDDRTDPSITAVLDYHPAGGAENKRFGEHRSLFKFPLSDEWKAWAKFNGKPLKMAEFAAFLEDRIVDVIEIIPDEDEVSEGLQKFINICGGKIASPTKLVELSRGLKIFKSADVREAVNLATGEASISFEVEHRNQRGGKLEVPNLFLIAIPVFVKGALYRLAARLRYRETDEGLFFFYELWRADRAFDDALAEACERVRVETELLLFFGRPE